jgi:hypothetical protein
LLRASRRPPPASARRFRYPTRPLASGSCASAIEPALLGAGLSANALKVSACGVPRRGKRLEKGGSYAHPKATPGLSPALPLSHAAPSLRVVCLSQRTRPPRRRIVHKRAQGPPCVACRGAWKATRKRGELRPPQGHPRPQLVPHVLTSLGRRLSCRQGAAAHFISKTFSAHTPSQPHPGPPSARRRPAFLKVVRARSGRCGSHHMFSRAWVDGSSVAARGSSALFSPRLFQPTRPHNPTRDRQARGADPLFSKSSARDLDAVARTTRPHGPRKTAHLSASGSSALFSPRRFQPTRPQHKPHPGPHKRGADPLSSKSSARDLDAVARTTCPHEPR